MHEYALIMLNMFEYATILNVFDAVHSIKSPCKLLSSYRGKHIRDSVKHLRLSILQKE